MSILTGIFGTFLTSNCSASYSSNPAYTYPVSPSAHDRVIASWLWKHCRGVAAADYRDVVYRDFLKGQDPVHRFASFFLACYNILMNYQEQYQRKLTSADQAVKLIPQRCAFSMGMAVSEPPALLKALEKRIQQGEIEELRLYYMHSERAAVNHFKAGICRHC